ncbi:MAG TPA: DinB family protein [Fimbriimonadaceae bacterium]|nr:DinB family protein [Fimbriimonadaceae bacterium]
MAISLQEAVARRTEIALEDFAAAVQRVPTERLEWQPIGDARPVLEIVQECGRVNERWADMIASGEWIAWDAGKIEGIRSETADIERAMAYLRASTAKYAATVRALPDERLDVEFQAPWRSATMAEWLCHALWHLSYHEGQINYIQTLYGDWSYG